MNNGNTFLQASSWLVYEPLCDDVTASSTPDCDYEVLSILAVMAAKNVH
jgi:hypothetical protein